MGRPSLEPGPFAGDAALAAYRRETRPPGLAGGLTMKYRPLRASKRSEQDEWLDREFKLCAKFEYFGAVGRSKDYANARRAAERARPGRVAAHNPARRWGRLRASCRVACSCQCCWRRRCRNSRESRAPSALPSRERRTAHLCEQYNDKRSEPALSSLCLALALRLERRRVARILAAGARTNDL